MGAARAIYDERAMPMRSVTLPSAREFKLLAKTHTLVPVYRTVVADLETPVSAFLRLAAEAPEAFLLESVEGGERVGRYTFIGIEPYKKMVSRGRAIVVEDGPVSKKGRRRSFEGDIFEELKSALGGHKPARLPGLPPFTAGAVGFFAYDVVRQIERLPSLAKDELGVPDACLMFFDQVIAFDHVKKEIHLMVTADLTRESREGAYERAERRLNKLERRLAGALPKMSRKKVAGKLKITARTPKAAFLKAVAKTKEYVASGDVFQCVLSQRFDCEPGVDAFEVYRALRIVNPSPYMYFLRFGMEAAPGSGKAKASVAHIVGSSPELLVRVHGRDVEYRPIAGTRPRSADEAEDRALEAGLRADEKEVAEHIMLVDLGRNDVGRVSEYGSVRVKDLMFVERYSHVMHLVSAVEGKLKAELAPIDAFKACFPAGTLSGAPKIRAMEIIEELEPARRGVYGGSILYADFNGNLDSCIAIRTLFMDGKQGYIQAGAGIVADSVAENEYAECGNKARAVVRAIERARG
jgi:anthranilate synthase component 1